MVDLLDALHYMFEEDLAPSSGEQQEAREHTRTKIYVDLYGKKSYSWVSKKSPETTAGIPAQDFPAAVAEEDAKLRHYDYIPPTDMKASAAKPFGDVLDAPLG